MKKTPNLDTLWSEYGTTICTGSTCSASVKVLEVDGPKMYVNVNIFKNPSRCVFLDLIHACPLKITKKFNFFFFKTINGLRAVESGSKF